MSNRRWLAFASVVLVAPAVWVFLSTWWTLAGYPDDYGKQRLLEELFYTEERTGGWGPLQNLLPEPPEPVRVVVDLAEPEISPLEALEPCPERNFAVVLVPPVDTSDIISRDAKQQQELALVRSRNAVFKRYQDQLVSQRWSNWQLAAVKACLEATPFHSVCADQLDSKYPSSEEILSALENDKTIREHEGQKCLNSAAFTFEESAPE